MQEKLRQALTALEEQHPGTLVRYPSLSAGVDSARPFRIRLAPWAVAAAEVLDRDFGEDVELTVGVLPYPPGRRPRRVRAGDRESGPLVPAEVELLDPAEITAELDGPAEVHSGHTLRHALLLGNNSQHQIGIQTNGQITARIVDPQTGAVIGGFAGAQGLPRIIFRIDPGQRAPIPLVIGTASFDSRLGYTVPAGDWGVEATVKVIREPGSFQLGRTPVLPISVTG
jgi:hypothetical protein